MAPKKSPKVNKAKAKRAGNSCCPIIRVRCELTKGRTVAASSVREDAAYGEKINIGGGKKVCTVIVGNRTVLKRADSARTGKKVAELRKQLLDKRCMGVVVSEDGNRKSGSKQRVTGLRG